ncbi:hypothetical protein NC651_034350 [Populus alba x Populus x berolinensis]|nr:hypothetical protein NC651_034350 [Populus alba x Populus x berolinensis]
MLAGTCRLQMLVLVSPWNLCLHLNIVETITRHFLQHFLFVAAAAAFPIPISIRPTYGTSPANP